MAGRLIHMKVSSWFCLGPRLSVGRGEEPLVKDTGLKGLAVDGWDPSFKRDK